jgi:glycerol 3-phosphatase-2
VTWAIDLDGVVWLAGEPLPGAAEAVTALRRAGERVVFLTNNSGPLASEHLERLEAAGIDARPDELVTSAQAAASLVGPGAKVAVVGDRGVREALAEVGAEVVPPGSSPSAVVVGRKVKLDYDELAAAADDIRAGARFVATNTDATFPVGEGALLPGAGALVAFVATSSGRSPEVAGKPHKAMADLVRRRCGRVDVMVGDRPDTDGLFAKRVGASFGLVLSGVTGRKDLPVEPAPELVAEDLFNLVRCWLDHKL